MDFNFFEKLAYKGKISCVSSTGLRDSLTVGKILFLGVTVRVSLEESSF